MNRFIIVLLALISFSAYADTTTLSEGTDFNAVIGDKTSVVNYDDQTLYCELEKTSRELDSEYGKYQLKLYSCGANIMFAHKTYDNQPFTQAIIGDKATNVVYYSNYFNKETTK
ncbi:hypothetical protein CPT_Moabite_272 [Serratia phage Moabite]|uniref:Uncharacterized protein n=2 Tax=Moabitevirus moabite TaxID=2846181 RepID=A0A7T3NBY4_9CAUD|nr:hypothetical protein HWC48_gp144 [Serratia phage Moabite]QDB71302.1 hypothetical protein CPT_Moabite_272 [Serratia phage Moabite]QPX76882.1 hypothetical protein [Serratia phage vB_SmaM_Yaphecito]UGO54155.1 hypothetical protein HAYMO_173 [Serratia phage vB_SmaM_Haymo]